ncbi:MAG: hypothetical protein KAT77_04600 [Nanoarchaeota archaeon]|nr:hypothetical protein [Nanoarchaeota archaeon]
MAFLWFGKRKKTLERTVKSEKRAEEFLLRMYNTFKDLKVAVAKKDAKKAEKLQSWEGRFERREWRSHNRLISRLHKLRKDLPEGEKEFIDNVETKLEINEKKLASELSRRAGLVKKHLDAKNWKALDKEMVEIEKTIKSTEAIFKNELHPALLKLEREYGPGMSKGQLMKKLKRLKSREEKIAYLKEIMRHKGLLAKNTLFQIAGILIQFKCFDEAIKVYEGAGAWKLVGDTYLRRVGTGWQNWTEYEKAGEAYEKAKLYKLAGETYFEGKKKYFESAKCFEKAKAWKLAGNAWFKVSRVKEDEYYKEKRYERGGAILETKEAQSLGREMRKYLVLAAECFEKAGEWKLAGNVWSRLDITKYWEKAGECYEKVGNRELAIKAWKRAGKDKRVRELLRAA